MTPLIRYVPGDLVKRRVVDCRRGAIGYQILGREAEAVSLVVDGASVTITDRDILEVLEPLPEVARRHLHGMPTHLQDVGIGAMYSMEKRPDGMTLRIELRFPPTQFPDRVAALGAEIGNHLQSALPTLAAAMAARQLRIEFVPPNTLSARAVKT